MDQGKKEADKHQRQRRLSKSTENLTSTDSSSGAAAEARSAKSTEDLTAAKSSPPKSSPPKSALAASAATPPQERKGIFARLFNKGASSPDVRKQAAAAADIDPTREQKIARLEFLLDLFAEIKSDPKQKEEGEFRMSPSLGDLKAILNLTANINDQTKKDVLTIIAKAEKPICTLAACIKKAILENPLETLSPINADPISLISREMQLKILGISESDNLLEILRSDPEILPEEINLFTKVLQTVNLSHDANDEDTKMSFKALAIVITPNLLGSFDDKGYNIIVKLLSSLKEKEAIDRRASGDYASDGDIEDKDSEYAQVEPVSRAVSDGSITDNALPVVNDEPIIDTLPTVAPVYGNIGAGYKQKAADLTVRVEPVYINTQDQQATRDASFQASAAASDNEQSPFSRRKAKAIKIRPETKASPLKEDTQGVGSPTT